MKLYNTNLTFQNFGSSWLIILRGAVEDINQSFNSFFNLNGANGSIDITDNNPPVGVFWSNEKAINRYWQNRFLLLNPSYNDELVYQGKDLEANIYVEKMITEMRQNQEVFVTFNNKYILDEHQTFAQRSEN